MNRSRYLRQRYYWKRCALAMRKIPVIAEDLSESDYSDDECSSCDGYDSDVSSIREAEALQAIPPRKLSSAVAAR
ncbi:hypothetical protein AAVH_41864 [Aphelenchoides avenae]|nr:hypothetical protein AAVH_41864 [Aphelenchus avenae]